MQLHETSGVPSGTVWPLMSCTSSPGPCPTTRWWWWTPIGAYACFAYGRGAQHLRILHEDGHYDTLTSLPGFFGKSYFCSFCYQPYNHAGQHACTNNPTHCGGCLQNGCSDYRDAYAHYQSPTVSCPSCRRAFYGPHLSGQPPRSDPPLGKTGRIRMPFRLPEP